MASGSSLEGVVSEPTRPRTAHLIVTSPREDGLIGADVIWDEGLTRPLQ